MWHKIEFVAESRKVDTNSLRLYVIENWNKYGALRDKNDNIEISTWFVDKLVEDFKNNI